MQARAYLLPRAREDQHPLMFPVIISLICHLIFFALAIYSPGRLPGRRMSQTIVNVNLVTLSQIQAAPDQKGPASGKAAVRPAAEKISPPKAAPSVKPAAPKAVPPEAVSLAPKTWSEKKSLKQETFKPDRVVKRAIKQIEEQAEASRPNPVAEAIDRIRGKIGEAETDNRLPDTGQATGTAETGGGGVTGQGSAGGITAPEILVYQQEIAYYIRSNWAYPDQLAGQRKDLEARLLISIMANGEIKDVRFEKKSGNSYLDDSAYKAVVKSNPLPALPKGYRTYTVMLGFTPAGLQ